jgi:hypothetical protein
MRSIQRSFRLDIHYQTEEVADTSVFDCRRASGGITDSAPSIVLEPNGVILPKRRHWDVPKSPTFMAAFVPTAGKTSDIYSTSIARVQRLFARYSDLTKVLQGDHQ